MQWSGRGLAIGSIVDYEVGKGAPALSFYIPGPTIDWRCWNSDEENWEKTVCPGRTTYISVSRALDGKADIYCYDVN